MGILEAPGLGEKVGSVRAPHEGFLPPPSTGVPFPLNSARCQAVSLHLAPLASQSPDF